MAKRVLTVEEHERRIQGVFRGAYIEGGWSAAIDTTPLDVLLAEEYERERLDSEEAPELHYWPSSEMPDIELSALKKEEAAQVAEWVRRRLVMWIIGEGLHPFHIVQRVYALLFSRYQEFLGPLNQTTLAEILNQGKAAFSALVKRLFTKPVKEKTGVLMVSPGMKSEKARTKYAAHAKKQKPKRKVDAVRVDEGAEKAEAARKREADALKVQAAREDYERRKLAKELGCEPHEIDLNKIKPKDDDDQ